MIKLYTTHCPKCAVLEKKLQQKNIAYETIDDREKMIQMGMRSAPMLEVDNKLMNFTEAVQYVNER